MIIGATIFACSQCANTICTLTIKIFQDVLSFVDQHTQFHQSLGIGTMHGFYWLLIICIIALYTVSHLLIMTMLRQVPCYTHFTDEGRWVKLSAQLGRAKAGI